MNARQLEEKIFEELRSAGNFRTRCGIDAGNISFHLIPPVKEKYFRDGKRCEYWLALAESISTPDYGKQIIYCELEDKFGLALAEGTGKIFLRFYPSFLEALEAM